MICLSIGVNYIGLLRGVSIFASYFFQTFGFPGFGPQLPYFQRVGNGFLKV